MTLRTRFAFCWLVFAACVVAYPPAAKAQDAADPAEAAEDAPLSEPPIGVLNIASVERVLEDVDYLFGSADRSDMSKVVEDLLGNIGDLRGLERGKPFGVMLFLKPGLVPTPAPVGYLPVADAAALSRTVELGPVVTKKIAEDRYEIVGQRQTLYARMIGGYAFVANEDALLDREFPVPTEAFAGMTTRYDVAVEVRPENIPPGMRDLFVNLLRTNAQAELQRRDNESEAAYAFRKSQGMNNLRMVEALLKETRSLTLGLDTSSQSRKAVLELVIDAIPDTPYLEALQSLAEEPSRFAPLLEDEVPLSFSVNSKLDEHSRNVQIELLNAGELQTAKVLTWLQQGEAPAAAATDQPRPAGPDGVEADPASAALAARVFEPIKAVTNDGNIDGFAQFLGDPEQRYVAIVAVEMPGAVGMESAIREIVDRVRAGRPEIADEVEVQYGAAEAGGVPLHRISAKNVRDQDKEFWGEAPALYLGFDDEAVWAGLGAPRVVDVLNEAITRVKEAGPAERNAPGAPFQIIITANRWVGLDPDGENVELAREAFADGDDALKIDFRPTENGGRLRVEVEEGFIRLLGLGVSKRYDERQRRDEERQEAQEERREENDL